MKRLARRNTGMRKSATACVAVALIAGVLIAGILALAGAGAVSGQESPGCDERDLGALSGSADAVLEADGYRNSRIEKYLEAGIYFIEATTYLERDYQPLQADFTLTVHLVDGVARQQSFQLKVEQIDIPGELVAGDPFTVNYRIGNSGGGDLPAGGSEGMVATSVKSVAHPSEEVDEAVRAKRSTRRACERSCWTPSSSARL